MTHLLLCDPLRRLSFEALYLLLRIDLAGDHGGIARREIVLALCAWATHLLVASGAFFDLRLLIVWLLLRLLVGVGQLPVERHQVLMVSSWHAHVCL